MDYIYNLYNKLKPHYTEIKIASTIILATE